MNTNNINAYLNKPLTIDIWSKLIGSSKNLAVIYSFKRRKDLYIGRAVNLQARLRNHFSKSITESVSCRLLYEAVRKYGWDAFVFNIIEVIPYHEQGEMASKEIGHIKRLQPALNIRHSQENRPLFSESTRKKLSEKATGRPVSESTRDKMSSSHGNPVIVNCLTDKIEKTYDSYRHVTEELHVQRSTIKSYIDSGKIYTSRNTKKQYKFYSVKK